MDKRSITLIEIAGILFGITVFAGIFLPSVCGRRHPATLRCANNLRQLHTLGTVYAASHRGEWPDAQGEELWLSFTKTIPPLVEADHLSILCCPIRDEEFTLGDIHYRGPRGRWNRSKPPRVLGADKIGNHGEDFGGNVLLGDGSVEEVELRSELWDRAASTLSP